MDSLDLPVVPGFRFAGISCGIKSSGAPDLGAIVADEPATVAAVFTKNLVRAAPVDVASERVAHGVARAILVNSGNANACTGDPGLAAAKSTTAAFARALGMDPSLVLPASTGVIGEVLPGEKIERAIPALSDALSRDGAAQFARSIMTTDRWPKAHAARVARRGGVEGTVLGIAKGAGMIHPNMATTLVFLVTDVPVARESLQRALVAATDRTFNKLSVDGDTSTNDSIFVLSTRTQDAADESSASSDAIEAAMTEVLDVLGKSIVRDGEGAEHLVRIDVVGARDNEGAHRIAECVATSMLVKTALHGPDPNWGRILAAAGRAGIPFDPRETELRFENVLVMRHGLGLGSTSEAEAREIMRRPEYTITLRVGHGTGAAHYFTCDLGHEYIRINASYRS